MIRNCIADEGVVFLLGVDVNLVRRWPFPAMISFRSSFAQSRLCVLFSSRLQAPPSTERSGS